jgi:hypothetical protein
VRRATPAIVLEELDRSAVAHGKPIGEDSGLSLIRLRPCRRTAMKPPPAYDQPENNNHRPHRSETIAETTYAKRSERTF